MKSKSDLSVHGMPLSPWLLEPATTRFLNLSTGKAGGLGSCARIGPRETNTL